MRHLRPASPVHRRHRGFVPHPAVACGLFLRVPPLTAAVRPRALLREGYGAGGRRTRNGGRLHCCRKVVSHLRFDAGMVSVFTHFVLPFFPSFFAETKR